MTVIFHAVDATEGSVFTPGETRIGDIVESEGVQYVVPNASYLPISRVSMPERLAERTLTWLGYQVEGADWQAPLEDFEAKLLHVAGDQLPKDVNGILNRLREFAEEARRRGAVRVYVT